MLALRASSKPQEVKTASSSLLLEAPDLEKARDTSQRSSGRGGFEAFCETTGLEATWLEAG